MANPLDDVTQDQSQDDPTSGLRRVMIYGDPQTPAGDALVPSQINSPLAQAVAPGPDDLPTLIGKLKDRLLGTGGQERYQMWPERMVREGLSAPGDVLARTEPSTSESLIAPALATSALAGGGALTERPGTGTLGSGPMRTGVRTVPTEPVVTPTPVFYSALEHAATNAPQNTMAPQQWMGYLKNQPGVKKEEMDWTGVGDWLGQQKGKVNKDDVQAYLDAHKTEIKDVTKGGIGDADEAIGNRTQEIMDREHSHLDPGSDEWAEAYDDAMMRADDELRGGVGGGGPLPKHESYQLPGGENYREHLLALPSQKPKPFDSGKEFAKAQGVDWDNLDAFEKLQYAQQAANQNKNAAIASGDYHSSHWDEPNVLAHVRTNDRFFGDASNGVKAVKGDDGHFYLERDGKRMDGGAYMTKGGAEADAAHYNDTGSKKSLHIEEIQSDWHQQGRKQGYKLPVDRNEADKAEAALKELGYKIGTGRRLTTLEGKDVDPVRAPDNVADAFHRWLDESNKDYKTNALSVPDAPFKTTWPELALKRMIRHAAENGYDRISWTPGEAQAARYDLSKQINEIRYKPNTGQLEAWDKNNKIIENFRGKNIKPEQLPEHIGKEAADKIINNPTEKSSDGTVHALTGVDLKVGGEGMREFYDKMLPKMVDKIGKAHGVKVKQTTLHNKDKIAQAEYGRNFDQLDQKRQEGLLPQLQSVHYFDLPQSLKDAALHKGFPLYMSGVPFPLVPVDYDPFKQKEKRK